MPADRRAGRRQGPYVYSGRQPRARRNDGGWYRKRSDAGRPRTEQGTSLLEWALAGAAIVGLYKILTGSNSR